MINLITFYNYVKSDMFKKTKIFPLKTNFIFYLTKFIDSVICFIKVSIK